jgi:hypothetical protein
MVSTEPLLKPSEFLDSSSFHKHLFSPCHVPRAKGQGEHKLAEGWYSCAPAVDSR